MSGRWNCCCYFSAFLLNKLWLTLSSRNARIARTDDIWPRNASESKGGVIEKMVRVRHCPSHWLVRAKTITDHHQKNLIPESSCSRAVPTALRTFALELNAGSLNIIKCRFCIVTIIVQIIRTKNISNLSNSLFA